MTGQEEVTIVIVPDTSTGALKYAWLGGKERATDASGLVLMGVRLYNSVTGHFTSVDPVKGGNTTRYAYPQDPINKFDLDGNAWGWAKKAWGTVKKAVKSKEFWVRTGVGILVGVAVTAVVTAGCIGTAGWGCVAAAGLNSSMAFGFTGEVLLAATFRRKPTGKQASAWLIESAASGPLKGAQAVVTYPIKQNAKQCVKKKQNRCTLR